MGYRRKVYEAIPKLRGLDGYREGAPIMEPGQIDEADNDNLQYNCDEEWFNPDIYLTSTVAKDTFNKSSQSSKEELDFKNLMKDCDMLYSRKTNVLTL